MNKRLIVHIGTYKTGTSYLQNVLSKNKKQIAKYGLFYPDKQTVNHSVNLYPLFDGEKKLNAFTIAELGDIPKPDMVKKLKTYWQKELNNFNSSKYDTFIISAELLCNLDEKKARDLKEFFSPYFDEVKILCYVRETKSYIISVVQEMVKNGYITLDMMEKVIHSEFNVRNCLQSYINVFGKQNVVVRAFEKNRMNDGDLLSDFFNIILPQTSINLNLNGIQANKSLGQNSLIFLSEFNKLYPLYDNKGNVNISRKPMLFFQDIQHGFDKKIDVELPIDKRTANELNEQNEYADNIINDGHKFEKIGYNDGILPKFDYDMVSKEFMINMINEYEARLSEQNDIGVKAFVSRKLDKYKHKWFKKYNQPTRIN